MAEKINNTYFFRKPQGGGGGSSDAVKYTSQTLTEPQQMQARANQGLYYTGSGEGEVTLNWDGDTTGKESVMDYFYKVSDDTPESEDLKSVTLTAGGEVEKYEPIPSNYITQIGDGAYVVGEGFCVVVPVSEIVVPGSGATLTKGIWFPNTGDAYTSQLVYDGTVEVDHPIDKKYLTELAAVEYTEQDLTEAQQMQARENLDLYRTMTEVVTGDYEGGIYYVPVDSQTGTPDSDYWHGIYTQGSTTKGFVNADVDAPSGYSLVSHNGGYLINGREPNVTSGTNYQKMVDPNNQNAILILTTADNVSVSNPFYSGSIYFSNAGLYASAELEIQNLGSWDEPYYEGQTNALVDSFSENLTVSGSTTTQVPANYIPTQSINASADNSHFATTKGVYDYILNNPPSGALRYDAAQSLNYTQKNRAIQNLGIENKIGMSITISQYALDDDWTANASYEKMETVIRSGGKVTAIVTKNIELTEDGYTDYWAVYIGSFSCEIIGDKYASPRTDKIVFSNIIYGESSLEIDTITFLPSSSATPSGTFAKYTFNATKSTTP